MQRIFSLYNGENLTLQEIADLLNKQSVAIPSASSKKKYTPGRDGKVWYSTMVRRILRNQTYTAKICRIGKPWKKYLPRIFTSKKWGVTPLYYV